MQTVKKFVLGRDYTGTFNGNPIEDQINEYLEYHPGYSVATMDVLNATGYKEAYVVFNIREERTEKDNRRQGKSDFTSSSTKDYKSQTKAVTTAHNPAVVNDHG